MRLVMSFAVTWCAACVTASSGWASTGPEVQVWKTTVNGAAQLAEQQSVQFGSAPPTSSVITVDPAQSFQTMLGFGGTLTDASAAVLTQDTTPKTYVEAMNALFSPTAGIGLDLLRVPIGGNDFSLGTYAGPEKSSNNYNEDPERGPSSHPLKYFTIKHDRAFLIPVLRRALSINPSLQIMATPWSAPGWMKLGGKGYDNMDGGSLNSKYIADYAQYLVEFVTRYRQAHVPIHYLTLQNEPLNSTSHYPSMTVGATQEAVLAKDVARDLANQHLAVQILGFDDNWDQWSNATQFLTEANGNAFAGMAFHCYGVNGQPGNDPSQAQPFFNAFPATRWFETECTPLGFYTSATRPTTSAASFSQDLVNNTRDDDIDSVLDGSGSVMLFNIALNYRYGPTINKGCLPPHSPCLPLVAISEHGDPFYEVGYYALGQLSKFVHPGAVRIRASSTNNNLSTVAFRNTDGTLVLEVLNASDIGTASTVDASGNTFQTIIPSGSVETFVWTPDATTGTQAPCTASTGDVSVYANGCPGTTVGDYPFISDDGRYVWFSSLDALTEDSGTTADSSVFVRDLDDGTTRLVAADGARVLAISADGNYAVIDGTVGGSSGFVLYDLATGVSSQLPVEGIEAQPYQFAVSDDGQMILEPPASPTDLVDVYQVSTGQTTAVACPDSGRGESDYIQMTLSANDAYAAIVGNSCGYQIGAYVLTLSDHQIWTVVQPGSCYSNAGNACAGALGVSNNDIVAGSVLNASGGYNVFLNGQTVFSGSFFGTNFCGITSDGTETVYDDAGAIEMFDATTGQTTTLATGGACFTGTVSANGEVVYLGSNEQLFVAGP